MKRMDATNEARSRAKMLRKDLTPSEKVIWRLISGRQTGFRFRRQEPVGSYIADFLSYEAKLVVEADGEQHEESQHDARRDAFLSSKGFRVLRFENVDVAMYPDWVFDRIMMECKASVEK